MENPKDKFIADGPTFRVEGCAICLYVRGKMMPNGRKRLVCDAYPNGIPFRLMERGVVHDSIQKDQVGTLTFVSIEAIWAEEEASSA